MANLHIFVSTLFVSVLAVKGQITGGHYTIQHDFFNLIGLFVVLSVIHLVY